MHVSDARVVTPEAVALRFETAGPGSRFLARSIDTLIQIVALLILVFAAGAAGAGGVGSTAALIVVLVAVFLLLFGYPAALETLWQGRTIGKAALALRVVTREGAPIRFRHAAIRSALFPVDGLLLGPSVGVLTLMLSRDNQRLGDLAAGTIVVRERSGARAPVAVTFPVPPGCEAYVASLDVAGITADDYEAVRALLLRSPSLRPNVRWELARQLGTTIAGRMRHTPPSWVGPELFLACVAAAVQRRFGGMPAPAPAPNVANANPAPAGQWGVARPVAPSAPDVDTDPNGGFAPPA